MGLFDDALPGGSIAKPLMVALGALLVGKMMGGSSSEPSKAPAPQPSPSPDQPSGPFGGLYSLIDRLTNAGQKDTVSSWLGSGPNAPIQPQTLGSALGQTTVSDLARQAGMSEQELLAQLSRVLPGVVDKLTPGGRIPSQTEIAEAFRR
jgi:uncharacterized protein YidB (DUF937 family)